MMETNVKIGVTGLEPAAFQSRTGHSTKLSYTPLCVTESCFQDSRAGAVIIADCGPCCQALGSPKEGKIKDWGGNCRRKKMKGFFMTRFPLTAAILPCFAALTAAQVFAPTARAETAASAPDYSVRVLSQTVKRGVGGLVIQGRLRNIGRKPLTYTQVLSRLTDSSGQTVFRGHGYLTISPLPPGAAAEFRVCEPDAPTKGKVEVAFQERGHPVVCTGNARVAADF